MKYRGPAAALIAALLLSLAVAAPARAAGEWCDTGNFFYKPNTFISDADAAGVDPALLSGATRGGGGYCIANSYGYAGGGSGAATSLGAFVRTGSLGTAAGATTKVAQLSDGWNTVLQAGRTILGALSGIGNLSMLFDPEADIFSGTGEDLSGWVDGRNVGRVESRTGVASGPVEWSVNISSSVPYLGSGDVTITTTILSGCVEQSYSTISVAAFQASTGNTVGMNAYTFGGVDAPYCAGSTFTVTRAVTGLQRVYVPNSVQGTANWYPEGYVGRYEDDPTGVPTGSVRVDQECVQANGVTSVLTASASIALDGSVTTPEVACPAGSVAGDTTVTHIGTSGTETVIGGATADAFTRSIPDEFPNCTEGGCTFELWQLPGDGPALFCGSTALGCPGWMQQTQTHPDSYQCRYGGYSVDLGYCSVYRQPGTVSPLVGYELDPTTGTVTQTAAAPIVSTDPAAYSALDTVLAQFLRDWAAYAPDPASPSPSAPPAGEVQIGGGASSQSGECFPQGWGIFNPIEWVLQPVKCALEWAFVPGQANVEATLYQGRYALENHGIFKIVPTVAEAPAELTDSYATGCSGGIFSTTVDTGYGDWTFGLPCSPTELLGGQFASQWNALYATFGVLLLFSGMWGAFVLVRSYFGGKD